MVHTSDQGDVSEADLLLPFELATLEGDYRAYQRTRRNNCFASMQRLPDLWRVFAQLDACWRAGLDDMRRITSPDDMLPLSLYIRAHAQTRISADLLFSGCLPEAASALLRFPRGCLIEARRHELGRMVADSDGDGLEGHRPGAFSV
jgi:hypothetical protein